MVELDHISGKKKRNCSNSVTYVVDRDQIISKAFNDLGSITRSNLVVIEANKDGLSSLNNNNTIIALDGKK